MPFSGGIVPLAFGNPIAASVMHAIELRVWLRPVSRHDRVGEHKAVVCHCVYRSPALAMRSIFGIGFSLHNVPSLSNTATRSAGATNPAEPGRDRPHDHQPHRPIQGPQTRTPASASPGTR